MQTLRLDDIEGLPVFGTLVWKPVRRTLGVTAFGINAYTAANAGDEVVEEHTEETYGHEEIYVVVNGHATFTVDGEEVDAPAGTLVYLDDVKQKRHAIATEAGTTVLAIGGKPGVHEISAWESWFVALPAISAGRYDEAERIMQGELEREDTAATRYNLACIQAKAGRTDAALANLELALQEEKYRDLARRDDDLASLRGDSRFEKLTSPN